MSNPPGFDSAQARYDNASPDERWECKMCHTSYGPEVPWQECDLCFRPHCGCHYREECVDALALDQESAEAEREEAIRQRILAVLGVVCWIILPLITLLIFFLT